MKVEKSNSKRLFISVIANIIACLVNIGIGFFLTPYVVNNIGSDAYGFVTLANNFTGYASILVIALNSMAGRFITIEYQRKNYDEANKYFMAVICGNIFMCILLLLPIIICVARLDSFLKISSNLLLDVQILFGYIFIAFLVSLCNAAFSTATFVTNRKDIEAKRNIESYLLKAIVLVVLFRMFEPHVYYVGIATILTSLYILCMNIYYTKKLIPEFRISILAFEFSKVKVLVKAGIWNLIVRVSSILSEGLDLLVANLFIGSQEMGILAVAKTLPSVISTLVGTVSGVFMPSYMIAYAKNDKEELISRMRQSMIILGIISNVCLVVLIVVGKDFYRLWVPEENENVLQLLSILTISGMTINGGVQCVYNIFTVVNKLKAVSVVSIICNVINVLVVIILLNTTDLGVFAIASVSSVFLIIRSLFFSIPYAAHCVEIDIRIFMKPVLLNLLALLVCSLIGNTFKMSFELTQWWRVIAFSGILSIIVIGVSLLLMTNRNEKQNLFFLIKKNLR